MHDGTNSIVTKENNYGGLGSYCDDPASCPPDRTASDPGNPEASYITRLSSGLVPKWQYQNTSTLSLHARPRRTAHLPAALAGPSRHPLQCPFRTALRARAPIAQLDRATDYGSVGWGFDSSWVHQ